MKKSKYYYKCKFSPNVVRDAHAQFLNLLDNSKKIDAPDTLSITRGNETWEYDTFEEFITEYKRADDYYFEYVEQGKHLIINGDKYNTRVLVRSNERKEIERIFQIFESNLDENILRIEKEPIKIFIGHGHDEQWRDLKDHLHEKHGLEVIAYEIGPRAGLSIKEVLESMFGKIGTDTIK